MELLITELMDGYIDDEFWPSDLEDPGLSIDRIKELTMAKINAASTGASVRHIHKLGRTLLIAAVIAVLLAIAAFAVYQIAFKDVLFGEPYGTENLRGEAALHPWERIDISTSGIASSPEYQAYVEWKEWNDAWWAENPDPFSERGIDDTQYETAENYAWLYQAFFREQADKLDEITEKYGLTLHTLSTPFYTEDELCAILGVSDIWRDETATDYGSVFENGAFSLSTLLDSDVLTYVVLNVDGSFSTLYMSIVPDYDEWSYETADGVTVTLAMAQMDDYPDIVADPINVFLVARLDEATVTVSFTNITTREEAEACADRLNLAELSELFSADADRSHIPAAVAEYKEVYQAELAERRAAMEQAEERQAEELARYMAQHTEEEWDALVTAELGDYALPETLPGQYLLERGVSYIPSSQAVSYYHEETPCEYAVHYTWSDESYEDDWIGMPTYSFKYQREWTDESHTQSVTRELFERDVSDERSGWETRSIGGYDVYVSHTPNVGTIVQWYDEGRDLRFAIAEAHIINDPGIFAEDQVVGLAESFIESLGAG